MCLFRERKESVTSKHNQQRKKKKRESIQIHAQERTCVLCSIVIPLNLPFIKKKKAPQKRKRLPNYLYHP